MRGFAVVVLLAVCAFSVDNAEAQDCQLKQYDSLPLSIVNERVLIPVKVGDVQKDFALQFGNALNGMSEATVKEFGLSKRTIDTNLNVVRDQVKITYLTRAPQFQLGRIPLKNVEFIVLPSALDRDGIAGDIGLRLLSKADIELDFAGKKFNLFSQDHCPGKVVYWTKSGYAQVPFVVQETGYVRPIMQLDGQPVRVSFEPNEKSIIGMNAMRRIFGMDENAPGMKLVGQDEQGRKVYSYPFKGLAADGLTVTNPLIRVVEEAPRPDCTGHQTLQFPEHPPLHSTEQPRLATCMGGLDVVLGYSVLSKLHMYFSIKEKLLYLTGADAH